MCNDSTASPVLCVQGYEASELLMPTIAVQAKMEIPLTWLQTQSRLFMQDGYWYGIYTKGYLNIRPFLINGALREAFKKIYIDILFCLVFLLSSSVQMHVDGKAVLCGVQW